MLSMSTIMHGADAIAPFSGGYCSLSEASFSFDDFVPGVKGFFGSFSA